jgi:hypothetical protein
MVKCAGTKPVGGTAGKYLNRIPISPVSIKEEAL